MPYISDVVAFFVDAARSLFNWLFASLDTFEDDPFASAL